MRVKITALTESPAIIPFNYNYALHSAIYGLMEKSSGEYSEYLHDKGFINEAVKKRFKLFTFSKLFFTPTKIQKAGFSRVKEITFINKIRVVKFELARVVNFRLSLPHTSQIRLKKSKGKIYCL